MCGFCGTIHQHSLVSSKCTLQDFEVLDVLDDGRILYVREVDVCSKKVGEHVEGSDMYVPSYTVELFESFYNRMQ